MADTIKNEDKDKIKATTTGLVDKVVDGINSIAGEDFTKSVKDASEDFTKSVKTNVNDTIHNFQESIQKPVGDMLNDVKDKLPKNLQDVKDVLPKNIQDVKNTLNTVNTKTSRNILYSILASFAAWKLIGLLRKK